MCECIQYNSDVVRRTSTSINELLFTAAALPQWRCNDGWSRALICLLSVYLLNQISSLVEEKRYNLTRAPEQDWTGLLDGEPMMSFLQSAVKVITHFWCIWSANWSSNPFLFLWLPDMIWILKFVQIVLLLISSIKSLLFNVWNFIHYMLE